MSSIPEGSIIITPAEVYAEVKALTNKVTELLAADHAKTKESTDLGRRLDQLEPRVTKLENKVWLAAGFCAALGSGIGVSATKFLGG